MDTANKDQFKKLTNEEKDKVINDLVLHPEDIICKSATELFVARPLAFKPINRLFIDFVQKEPSIKSGEEIISQFLVNRENMYIFKCDFVRDFASPAFFLSSDFYMIQRRENYRMKFPSALTSKVLIKSKNPVLGGKVFDLSTTGVRVSSANSGAQVLIGTELQLEIQVVGHEPLHISAHLRHRTEATEVVKDRKIPIFYFGFQFNNISKDNEKALSRINMELYRNFLQKVNG